MHCYMLIFLLLNMYTASGLKLGTVLEGQIFHCRSFTIWRKIYALGRLRGSPFKFRSKLITKILPRFGNNKICLLLGRIFWLTDFFVQIVFVFLSSSYVVISHLYISKLQIMASSWRIMQELTSIIDGK